ncbi:MAG TPA: LLM class flavin-dependent oxidoreductase [Chloroflexota bacterium]|nr:LLM class flavin-dependent oxidoreductase [Chloroflexota bacterium]
MEFGIFHEFERGAGRDEAESFEDAFQLVDAAERWGLDAVWLAELHFNPQRSVLSAPLTIASAVAARTSHIKIGTAVQVLPLHHPLRLAEETATIDHISHGRLIFGVGRSGFAATYQTYGVPYAESRERFAETLQVVKRAWTEPTFSHSGTYFQFQNVTLSPKPYQKPHPPIRIAATSPDTFPGCGELGYPIFAAVRLGTLAELGPNIEAYRAAYRANGHQGKGEVFLRVPVYVGDTEQEAKTAPEESIIGFYRMLGRQLEASAGQAGTRAIEDRANRGARLQSIDWQDVLRDKVIVGTPSQVAERLRSLQVELGLNGILAELNCGGLIPRERVLRSLQLLCEEVMARV